MADCPVASSQCRNRTFNIPDVVSQALDSIVEDLGAHGYRAGRSDVIAALIVGCLRKQPEDNERLVRSYLKTTVRDALGLAEDRDYVSVRTVHPGPRPAIRPAKGAGSMGKSTVVVSQAAGTR